MTPPEKPTTQQTPVSRQSNSPPKRPTPATMTNWREVAANPNDHQARFEYAEALSARGDLEAASDQLLTIIEKNREWNEGAARAQLLKNLRSRRANVRRHQERPTQAFSDFVLVAR